ncbi:acyl-homoserine-lactone synthase [Paracoccus aerodenitrificans]|uniref:acyl-homoserine-lactone synthase n=1 Tax=Paracoccus aerodenitrificans TaxID=3017781 RepID=UPI0022F05714|nr:acyl-homoserine-lactone synthase [Paracoccus aerodenitrificans]WBU64961.1 N-acyl-L-homoserine lactone synthetase [Paracoccus aerodenitrificans]
MQTTTISFANMHTHGELFANILRARRQSFIVQNNWDLPQAEGMEFDQYDTPASRWVAVHERGEVLAGIRLTPTTAHCGIYSYMIRDAQRGILGGSIPQNLLFDEAPVDDYIWESSRVFVSHAVPMGIRRKVHAQLIDGLNQAARELGATRHIGLINSNWPRWYRRCGMEGEAMGPVMQFDDGEFQVVATNLVQKLH